MTIKQVVEVKADHIYCGWRGLEIKDDDGNQVEVNLTDDQWLTLAERVQEKANRIRKDRREKLTKELEELNAESSC